MPTNMGTVPFMKTKDSGLAASGQAAAASLQQCLAPLLQYTGDGLPVHWQSPPGLSTDAFAFRVEEGSAEHAAVVHALRGRSTSAGLRQYARARAWLWHGLPLARLPAARPAPALAPHKRGRDGTFPAPASPALLPRPVLGASAMAGSGLKYTPRPHATAAARTVRQRAAAGAMRHRNERGDRRRDCNAGKPGGRTAQRAERAHARAHGTPGGARRACAEHTTPSALRVEAGAQHRNSTGIGGKLRK
eukprot:gene2034-8656_t